MRTAILASVMALLASLAPQRVAAQEDAPPAPPAPAAGETGQATTYDEIQALIDRMQTQIESMSQASSERDQALRFLEEQVEEATGVLSDAGETNEALKSRTAALGTIVEDLSDDREQLSSELEEVQSERDRLVASLEAQVAELSDILALEQTSATDLRDRVAALDSELATARNRAEGLKTELGAAQTSEKELEARVAALSEERESAKSTIGAQLSRIADLEADIEGLQALKTGLETEIARLENERTDEARRVAALEQQLSGVQARSRDLENRLGAAVQRASDEATRSRNDLRVRDAEIERLNRSVGQMVEQLETLAGLLRDSETREQDQRVKIAHLGQRLNEALAEKVEELTRYRSEFFQKLSEALGGRADIQPVGDRFVFQSEVLFASGSASLAPEGQKQLDQLAETLKSVAVTIPETTDWILRIDGHTDSIPIYNERFASNWELSTARAVSVVNYLISRGIPPQRLAATGFGEYHPIDPRDDEIGRRRNRRIEFRLTSR